MTNTEYLLTCLMEEAAEVQQIAAKCLRFGLDNHHLVRQNIEGLLREYTVGGGESIDNL